MRRKRRKRKRNRNRNRNRKNKKRRRRKSKRRKKKKPSVHDLSNSSFLLPLHQYVISMNAELTRLHLLKCTIPLLPQYI